jgi:hypothetical protein
MVVDRGRDQCILGELLGPPLLERVVDVGVVPLTPFGVLGEIGPGGNRRFELVVALVRDRDLVRVLRGEVTMCVGSVSKVDVITIGRSLYLRD